MNPRREPLSGPSPAGHYTVFSSGAPREVLHPYHTIVQIDAFGVIELASLGPCRSSRAIQKLRNGFQHDDGSIARSRTSSTQSSLPAMARLRSGPATVGSEGLRPS